MRRGVRAAVAGLTCLWILALGAPAGAGTGGSGHVRAASSTFTWPTYGYDVSRDNFNPSETALGTGTVGSLHLLWTHDLGAVAMDEPAFAAGLDIGGTSTDVVFIGSEHGRVVALDAATGAVIWRRYLGTHTSGCGFTPDGVYGVSGTPVLDRANNRLFVADGAGKLYALSMTTGATLKGWPITITSHPGRLHEYSGMTLFKGRLYPTFASYCDITPYHGFVSEVDVSTHKVRHRWYPDGSGGPSGGGVWSYGGVSVSPSTGNVYVATGNAIASNQSYGYANHVVRLSATLTVQASDGPGVTIGDSDFGSTPMLYQAPGCHPQFAVENKDGVLFVYDRSSTSSIDHGPIQKIQVAAADGSFIGVTAYDRATNMLFVSNSSDGDYQHGLVAFQVASCKLKEVWNQSVGAGGPTADPVVANGVVYFATPDGGLFAYDETDGAQLWTDALGAPVVASPLVADGVLYVATYGPGADGSISAFGP